jgi:hypothetical protein
MKTNEAAIFEMEVDEEASPPEAITTYDTYLHIKPP